MNNNTATWTTRPYFSFDAEATGPNPMDTHFVSSALVKIHNGELVDSREWLIKPAVEISEEAVEIHGITNEMASEQGRDAREALTEIIKMISQVLNSGHPLVVYNAAYDLTALEVQAEYYGIPGLRELVTPEGWERVIDPFVMAKGYEAYWLQEFVKGRTHKLPAVCERYGVPFEETHQATADALGAGLLAAVLVNEDKDLAAKGPAALNKLQKKWRQRIQDSLRKHFDKNEIEHDGVDTGWPLHSSLTA